MNIDQHNELKKDKETINNIGDNAIENLISRKDLCKKLNCRPYDIQYLFEVGKLNEAHFVKFGRIRLYKPSQVLAIKEILFRHQYR